MMLKRAGRYLLAFPRAVHLFAMQRTVTELSTFFHADHAGCVRSLKSTTGVVIMFGSGSLGQDLDFITTSSAATWCKSGVSQESGTAPRPRRSLGGFIGSGGAVPLEGLVKGAVAGCCLRPRDEGSLLRTMALSQTKCTRMAQRISCTYHSGNAPAFLRRAPAVAHDAVTSVGRSARGRVSQLKGLFSRSVHFVAVVSAGGACCRSVKLWLRQTQCLIMSKQIGQENRHIPRLANPAPTVTANHRRQGPSHSPGLSALCRDVFFL